MQVRLAGILPNSSVNGLGLRKTFFAQGCSHGCKDCFNKHTWDFSGGKMCDCDELIEETKDQTYLAGVSFSGGDPFDQPEGFAYLAQGLKKYNINIWTYTGYTWEQLIELSKTNQHIKLLLNNIDVLIDGPYIKEQSGKDIEFRGSSNQRIIDVVESLKLNKIILDKRFK